MNNMILISDMTDMSGKIFNDATGSFVTRTSWRPLVNTSLPKHSAQTKWRELDIRLRTHCFVARLYGCTAKMAGCLV